MKTSEEQRLGKLMIAAQERVRQSMFKTGPAAQWHIERAAKIVLKPKLLERFVPHLEGEAAQQYLSALGGWIAQTTQQDAKCAEVWNKRRADYPTQRDHLLAMLLRYDFTLRSYEKLARQMTLEPVAAGRSSRRESGHDESAMRMTEEEFGELQGKIDADLEILDRTRAELVAGHEDLVLKLVQKSSEKADEPIEEITGYARGALEKAAENFDVRQGRRFATYAQWWIKTAIKEKKTWDN
jgi:DNA-directed RNA polymerase sigma subunit (sigma70/sigma32)